MGRSMLKRLKRRASVRVDRNDLTIEYGLVSPQAMSRGCDGRIRVRQILVIPGANLDTLTVLQQQPRWTLKSPI
jgi:hypothetical protein